MTGQGMAPQSASIPRDGRVTLTVSAGLRSCAVTFTCGGRTLRGQRNAEVISGQILNLTIRVTVDESCAELQPRRGQRGAPTGLLADLAQLLLGPPGHASATALTGGDVMVAQAPPAPVLFSLVPRLRRTGRARLHHGSLRRQLHGHLGGEVERIASHPLTFEDGPQHG